MNTNKDNEGEAEVIISKKKYDQLIKDQAKLDALEAGGVDNWDFYDDSLEAWREEYCK